MNNVLISTFTVSDVLSALEDIGFTIDTTNGKAYWANDTNNKMHFSVRTSGSNTLVVLRNSSNTDLGNSVSFTPATAVKMTYEVIGDSVVFGFSTQINNSQKIQWAIIEPSTAEDFWFYCIGANSGLTYNGTTENSIMYGSVPLFSGGASAVQIAKYYDGSKFYDNLHITTVCANIPIPTATDANGSNFLEATVNNDNFLLINLQTNGADRNKIAIKRPSLTT
jgi:hypothetical protein